jgi:hypothetical protein
MSNLSSEKDTNRMDKPLCIYHGNCADGFTSAWVVRRKFGDADFHAGVYQQAPPDVTDRDVVMVDFSYKRDVLIGMREKARSVLVLDHHKTAEADLQDIPGVEAVFDMNRSGARITWDHYFPHEEPPRVLLHVEDRDLWRFKLPDTREIQANIFSFPYDFAVWDRLMWESPKKLALEGVAIERKHFKDVHELIRVVTRRMMIGGHNVPIANLPYIHVSDAAHELARASRSPAATGIRRRGAYSVCAHMTTGWTSRTSPSCMAVAVTHTRLASPSVSIRL